MKKIPIVAMCLLLSLVSFSASARTTCDSALMRLGGIRVCYADDREASIPQEKPSTTPKSTKQSTPNNIENNEFIKLTPKYISENQGLKEAYDKLILDYINNERRRLNEINEIVSENNWKSNFIFWIVHALLFLSISAAVYEFVKSRILMKWSTSKTELSIEAQKVAIKTSLQAGVCGLWALSGSMAKNIISDNSELKF